MKGCVLWNLVFVLCFQTVDFKRTKLLVLQPIGSFWSSFQKAEQWNVRDALQCSIPNQLKRCTTDEDIIIYSVDIITS